MALTLLLAVGAVLSSFAETARGVALERAVAVGWPNAQARQSLAAALYRSNPVKPPWALIDPLSKAALRNSALSPHALALTGFSREARGDRAGAAKAFQLADTLSRRSIYTHVWYISDSARTGQLTPLLKHFDFALRTNPETGSMLYPILAQTMAYPEMQDGFAQLVRDKPEWLAGAVIYLAGNVADPRDLARSITVAGGLPQREDLAQAEAAILQQLAARSGAAAARDYYLSLRNASPSVLERLAFTRATTNEIRQPVTWQTGSSSDLSAGFVAANSRGELALSGSASPDSSELLAQKLLFLAPGSYRLAGQVETSGSPDTRVMASLNCERGVSNWIQIWEHRLIGNAAREVTIPADCAAQKFVLKLEIEDSEQGGEVLVRGLAMTPAGEAQ